METDLTLEQFEQKYKLTTKIILPKERRLRDWNALSELNKWERASEDINIPIEAIEKYKDKLDWDHIYYDKFVNNLDFAYKWKEWINWKYFSLCFVKVYPEEVIREFADYIFQVPNFNTSFSFDVNINFVREFKDRYNWINAIRNDNPEKLSFFRNSKYTDEFEDKIARFVLGTKNKNYINWERFKFSTNFILKYRYKNSPFALNSLIENDSIEEDYIDKYMITEENLNNKSNQGKKDYLNFIFTNCTVSISLIKKKFNYIKDMKSVWKTICQYQKLDEEFINQYKDFVDWFMICKHQEMSEQFMEKHSSYINKFWDLIINNNINLSEQFIKKHWNEFNTFTQNKILKLKEENAY